MRGDRFPRGKSTGKEGGRLVPDKAGQNRGGPTGPAGRAGKERGLQGAKTRWPGENTVHTRVPPQKCIKPGPRVVSPKKPGARAARHKPGRPAADMSPVGGRLEKGGGAGPGFSVRKGRDTILQRRREAGGGFQGGGAARGRGEGAAPPSPAPKPGSGRRRGDKRGGTVFPLLDPKCNPPHPGVGGGNPILARPRLGAPRPRRKRPRSFSAEGDAGDPPPGHVFCGVSGRAATKGSSEAIFLWGTPRLFGGDHKRFLPIPGPPRGGGGGTVAAAIGEGGFEGGNQSPGPKAKVRGPPPFQFGYHVPSGISTPGRKPRDRREGRWGERSDV